jgi:DNA-directed RNA polymerase specialized sigma24 family protein
VTSVGAFISLLHTIARTKLTHWFKDKFRDAYHGLSESRSSEAQDADSRSTPFTEPEVDSPPEPEHFLSVEETGAWLQKAIDVLPTELQERVIAAVQTYQDGGTLKDAAAMLGIAQSTLLDSLRKALPLLPARSDLTTNFRQLRSECATAVSARAAYRKQSHDAAERERKLAAKRNA